MTYFKQDVLLNSIIFSKPFPDVQSIHWDAQQILRARGDEEIKEAANKTDYELRQFRARKRLDEVEERAQQLFLEGGWELENFDTRVSRDISDIRNLLTHWQAHLHPYGRSPYFSSDHEDDFATLCDLLTCGRDSEAITGLPRASVAELFAVLSLMRIDDALEHIDFENKIIAFAEGDSDPCPWPAQKLIEAANCVIEATYISCWAQHEVFLAGLSEHADKSRLGESIGARGREARYEPFRMAKAFVQAEWHKQKLQYQNNKTEFCRHYVPIVAHNFKSRNGDPLKITEKQMREEWLRYPV